MAGAPTDSALAGLRAATDLATVQRIVRSHARELAHADGATFVIRDVDHCFYADEDAISPLWKGQRFPISNCISGWAMLNAQTVVIGDITTDDRIPLESYRPTFVKSLAMVPIGGEKPVAAIGAYWARLHEATPGEVAALEALAGAAHEAIARIGPLDAEPPPALATTDPGALTGPVDRVPAGLAAGEDRERIARDLHDTILQRMFAAGLRLQGLNGKVADPAAAAVIEDVVTEIDDTIRELRGVIFGLEYGHQRLGGLAGEILAVVAEAARTLGFTPEVSCDGPLEEIGDSLRHEVTGALREMLSNVSRHARATAVRVECVSGPSVRLTVTDNGAGLPETITPGNGIANLLARAERLGGSFILSPVIPHGTAAAWSAPRHPGPHSPDRRHHPHRAAVCASGADISRLRAGQTRA